MASIDKTPSEEEIASTLTHLKLSTTAPQKPAHKPKSKPVADSWDDNSGSDTERESSPPRAGSATALSPTASDGPDPPPPTPASPPAFDFPDNSPYAAGSRDRDAGAARGGLDKRPEKTTAVAGRMIAGALGVRAPKRSEEEKEFDRAVREKERRRRGEEKEREKREAEATELRKKAVWDD
ncbi:hypothetical protein P153DRAFT_396592 [Dothidotthia symphoricarpi CBS 119687]|uniref:Ubiquitin-like protein smt3 n=1 Tax=Dothidotthia symphoricarpi CBS 119687 TaxID=1392245 RepID=A0A6A6ADY9_9PLEO|nr:uncharacterized protein P153DRAFT_396592 [Dothidotthia symphoricarpi CBS 119687]KAF2129305.1 hypothetical protein P153DRAFT_396592 [Dothidotthia symphoricarpi CBS 119687]